jgi:hypothetical protein
VRDGSSDLAGAGPTESRRSVSMADKTGSSLSAESVGDSCGDFGHGVDA